MHIKVNRFLPGYRLGEVVRVDDDGKNPPQPKNLYWFRRLKDAKIDQCCEIVTPKAPKSKAKKVKNND